MKILFNSRLYLLTCIIILIGMFSSCDKDDKNVGVDKSKVTLLSFGPTGALHGDTLRFFGHNMDKVTEIALTGASVMASSFVFQNIELIMIIVPESTEQGFVILKTPDGDVTSKTQLNLQVQAIVTSITPEARPGGNISIKGNYLNWVTSVTFSKDKTDTSFVSRSLTELVIKVPMQAQSGTLILSNGGTKPITFETDSSLTVTLPVATGLSAGPVLHASNLTISGTNLDLTTAIMFTGVTNAVTTFVSQSAMQIVVKVPASAKKGKITLVAPSGVTTQSALDLEIALPSITLLSPNPVATESDLIINGTNLNLVTGIAFTGVLSPVTTFVSQTATQIVVTVPVGVLKGLITLSVLNSTLTVQSPDFLQIIGGLPPLADFPLPIYTDAFVSGFQDWSWATRDINNTSVVRQGSKSILATYGNGGYEGITFHNDAGAATGPYTVLEFSIFGEAGTGGKKMNVVINGGWSSPAVVTLTEGEWTTYSLTLTGIGSPSPLKEIVLQSAGWSGVVHIDHVGLR